MQVRNSQFEKSLLNQIARVSSSLEREVENELKVSFKLTFSQFRVLNGLLALGEASGRELAGSLEVTPAVVTRQAEALGSRGLVTTKQNPRSKREKVLALTPKGEQAVVDAAVVIADRQKAIFANLSLKDETAFERAIEALGKALE
ncbi:MAG TPA: MarR family winged helix-turn-helix transcriptional regulator [Candidatus Saccharimonadia bacterium]|nr:MarR family winged helix-turn-helix transcriptional regulator [Candidatus Saccharimonadia bacterium]